MWHRCKNNCAFLPSRLARALWIEIPVSINSHFVEVSRLARALWIEIWRCQAFSHTEKSRLARALWIEILPKL